MSGQVSFTYIPPNLRIPLFSVEFDNSQAGANQDIQRAVLVGGTLITQPVAAAYVATVAQAVGCVKHFIGVLQRTRDGPEVLTLWGLHT